MGSVLAGRRVCHGYAPAYVGPNLSSNSKCWDVHLLTALPSAIAAICWRMRERSGSRRHLAVRSEMATAIRKGPANEFQRWKVERSFNKDDHCKARERRRCKNGIFHGGRCMSLALEHRPQGSAHRPARSGRHSCPRAHGLPGCAHRTCGAKRQPLARSATARAARPCLVRAALPPVALQRRLDVGAAPGAYQTCPWACHSRDAFGSRLHALGTRTAERDDEGLR